VPLLAEETERAVGFVLFIFCQLGGGITGDIYSQLDFAWKCSVLTNSGVEVKG